MAHELHIPMTVLIGTAKHLREEHGVEPGDDKAQNVRAHIQAHGFSESLADWPPDVRRIVRLMAPQTPV
jgi:hypothetical protein